MPRSFSSFVAVASALAAGVLATSCSKSISLGSKSATDLGDERPVRIDHEPCDVASGSAQKVDSNADGKVDIISVMSGGKEVCRALDLNMDGRIDRYIYLDDQGNVRRVESDYDRDGRIDEVAVYRGGQLVRKDREFNLDGKVDTWDLYQDGKLVRRERDSDGDGKVDQWWTFPDPNNLSCPIVAVDRDGAGHPTPGSEIDMCKPEGDEPANILATSSANAFATGAPASSSAPRPPAPAASSAAPASSAGAP